MNKEYLSLLIEHDQDLIVRGPEVLEEGDEDGDLERQAAGTEARRECDRHDGRPEREHHGRDHERHKNHDLQL